ncbi:MAG: PLP-dependent transferase [Labilibaculum sp.]|nr:PLP-dependent transferase [Labilibaculum sp.]
MHLNNSTAKNMTENPYRNIACGKSIPPNNVHAISVSLPTIQDVYSYEENKNNWRNCMETGYPRFFCHPYETMLIDHFKTHFSISKEKSLLLFPSKSSCQLVINFFDLDLEKYELNGIFALVVDSKNKIYKKICDFIQHTGYKVFSRQLEDLLLNLKLVNNPQKEELFSDQPEEHVKKELQKQFQLKDNKNIELFSSGMNAIYSIFEGINKIQKEKNATILIQYGWLYSDTINILKKYSESYFEIISVYDEKELLSIIEANKGRIAAVFTEIPTNPFLHTPNLAFLYSRLSELDIPLIVDGTIGTCVNMNYLPYCDFAVESLTKFASGMADVMAGCVVTNPDSNWIKNNSINLKPYQQKLYVKDLERIAFQISGMESRVQSIRKNAYELAQFFENHPAVKTVNWSHNEKNKANYSIIEKEENNYSGLISIEFDGSIEKFYNALELPKGPSLGTEFTLVMPYFYLAHYELVKSEEGRKILSEKNINWELIRISVGTEPIKELINIFEKALDKS